MTATTVHVHVDFFLRGKAATASAKDDTRNADAAACPLGKLSFEASSSGLVRPTILLSAETTSMSAAPAANHHESATAAATTDAFDSIAEMISSIASDAQGKDANTSDDVAVFSIQSHRARIEAVDAVDVFDEPTAATVAASTTVNPATIGQKP